MKSLVFVSLLIVSAFTKAQEGSCFYNGGLAASQTEGVSVVSCGQKQPSPLILMPYVMNEKEVMGILKEKKNPLVEKILTKVKLSKKMRLIGFAAIPTGIIGALSIVEANKNHTSQNAGLGLVALGTVSLGSSFYFNHERKKNYKKAIAKYNQLYN